MALTTPRYALPYPVAADPNNPPADLLALATALDNKMSSFISTTFAARPAAGLSGRFHYSTDTKEFAYDTGAAWQSLTGRPVIPLARYALTTAAVAVTGALTAIPWNNTTFNRNGFASIATPTTGLLLPVTGYYRVRSVFRVAFPAGTANVAVLAQILQGATVRAYKQEGGVYDATFGRDITLEIETRINGTAGDSISVKGACSPSGTYYNTADQSYVELELLTVT